MKHTILVICLFFLSGCYVEVSSGSDEEVTDNATLSPSSDSKSILDEESFRDLLQGKHSFRIGDGSFERTGSSDRTPDIYVKAQLGLVPKEELTIEEKIQALKEKVHFYEMMKRHGVDLSQTFTRSYSEATLDEVLDDILPQIEVSYDGYDKNQKMNRLEIDGASLEDILTYLDDASNSRFSYQENKLIVTKE